MKWYQCWPKRSAWEMTSEEIREGWDRLGQRLTIVLLVLTIILSAVGWLQ
jgi:hypothetical protein